MIFGVGIDIEKLGRFEKYCIEKPALEFLSGIFTPAEIDNYNQFSPQLCYALSFCCKEALFKALGISWTNSKIYWTDIELLFLKAPEKKKQKSTFRGML